MGKWKIGKKLVVGLWGGGVSAPSCVTSDEADDPRLRSVAASRTHRRFLELLSGDLK